MANEDMEMKEFEDAFGVEPDVTEDDVQAVEETPTEEAAEPEEVAETPAEEAAETPAESPDVAADDPIDEKELQRKRSWEGRLRAREAELKAKEDALKASYPVEKQDAPQAEPQAEQVEEAVGEAVDKLEDGFDVDTVMKEMAEDFGDDFARKLTKLIEHKAAQIVGKTVEDKVGTVSQKLETMLSGIKNSRVREHFETIAEKHPDFLDLMESGAIQKYIESLPEDKKAAAMQIAEGGTTRQTIKFLDAVKESQKPKEEVSDAADGVRSRGIKIPEKPTSTSYEDAWDQF